MADQTRTGSTLGRFFLEEELGAGAAGVVYRARDTVLGSTVALKVIHPELLGDVEVKERFKREILLSRRVMHKGVCRIYDLYEIEHEGAVVIALAMELLDGKTLASEVHDKGRLTPGRTLEVLEELVPALSAAHEAGVIHRDLKPGNVLLTSGGVKLLDFGMATADDVMRVTRPGNTVGSLRFIAPEVWEGEPASPRADLYALGVLLYACLTGRLPYDAKTPGEMFSALKKPPPPPSKLAPDLTPAMDAVVLKAMSRKSNERQRSARVILEEFRRAVEGESTLKVSSAGGGKETVPIHYTHLQPLPTVPFLSACAGALALALLVASALSDDDPRASKKRGAPDPQPDAGAVDEGAPPKTPGLDSRATTTTKEGEKEGGGHDAVVDAGFEGEPSRPPTRRVESADDERSELRTTMRRRGLVMADLPSVEALDDKARKLESQGDVAGARAALRQAQDTADNLAIDRNFIMAKQKRLVRQLDRASDKVKERVKPIEAQILDAFKAGQFEKANQHLNRAFSVVK